MRVKHITDAPEPVRVLDDGVVFDFTYGGRKYRALVVWSELSQKRVVTRMWRWSMNANRAIPSWHRVSRSTGRERIARLLIEAIDRRKDGQTVPGQDAGRVPEAHPQ